MPTSQIPGLERTIAIAIVGSVQLCVDIGEGGPCVFGGGPCAFGLGPCASCVQSLCLLGAALVILGCGPCV